MYTLIPDIEIIGRAKDSGYKRPTYLIRTPDKNYIQLTGLLFHTVAALKHDTDLTVVASKVSNLEKKEVGVQAIAFLIKEKLMPLGIITDSNSRTEKVIRKAPDMLLGLKYRFTFMNEWTSNIVANIFRPLFYPPVMIAVIVGFIAVNIWAFAIHGVNTAFDQMYNQPFSFLLIIGLLLLSTLFHEIGHAAACKYGGSKPGRIGCGMYLIWPAFFTDVTDVYRLNRVAKLRTDVGGIYFNAVFALFITGVYFLTQFEPLLLLIFIQDMEILHQLMPFVRLDGYFIVSDIIGIPDLFTRIKPLLKSLMPGQEKNAVKDLKPWARWVVSSWILLTIPLLAFFLILMLVNLPQMYLTAKDSAIIQIQTMAESVGYGEYLLAVIQTLQLLIILLPALGITFILFILSQAGIKTMYHSKWMKNLFLRKSHKPHRKFSPTQPIIIFQANPKS